MATQAVGDRDHWRSARLIPTSGIRGQAEQESRATSSLLAVMQAVPEFGRALLEHVGAPGGRITTFTEVPFSDADGKSHRPDGAIVIERGKTNWCCLVEVKTGTAALTEEQTNRPSTLTGLVCASRVIWFEIVSTPLRPSTRAISRYPPPQPRVVAPVVVADPDRRHHPASAPSHR